MCKMTSVCIENKFEQDEFSLDHSDVMLNSTYLKNKNCNFCRIYIKVIMEKNDVSLSILFFFLKIIMSMLVKEI